MTRLALWQAFVLIVLFVTAPYMVWKLSRSANGRAHLRVFLTPFATQMAILLALCAVEYDWLGLLPTELWTVLRVLCWLGSLFAPYTLQVVLLYRTPLLSRLSIRPLRALASGAISFPIALLGIVLGQFLFAMANHGLLFD
jgi:hypothetical protein